MSTALRSLLLPVVALLALLAAAAAPAQIHLLTDEERRAALSREATIERMLMVPMRDGVRLATRVYLPKDAKGPVPAICWRSPYDFSELMVPNPTYRDANLKFALDAVRNGYAFVMQNERGKFYSEGEWEILGRPQTDGHDALTWIAAQPWSTGKVGTIGCSSTAEWIMALAATRHPAHAAAVPMAMGAGIGKMGPYVEQGNFYRGGAIQLPMAAWLYAEQNGLRPQFPPGLTRDELIRVAQWYDLKPKYPDVAWTKAFRHLPLRDALREAKGPPGIFEAYADRLPGDPAWRRGGLYHDDMDFTVPALWVNSWYDLSVGPNLELFRHVRTKASDPAIRDAQWMIVAPTEHCQMYRLRQPHVTGDRDMGDVDMQLDATVWAFFDRYLKPGPRSEAAERFAGTQPRVRYFAMGENRWREAADWPLPGATRRTLWLTSARGANSLYGDGALVDAAPTAARADAFVYDPMNPVQTLGGNVCCLGRDVTPGSFDQRAIQSRQDVLVYTSAPLDRDIEVTGPIEVELHVSSDARDTDFTVKLTDVAPDGTAWNLDDTIQRARFREGYDREVFMRPGRVYRLAIAPLVTSNVFRKGHRIRVEVSSSNYPRYERNLNTGGANHRETTWVVARNAVHHGPRAPSRIVLSVVER
ncbi:MAG: CocE/NonD family hydrolase [Pseudomonadota bacterium]